MKNRLPWIVAALAALYAAAGFRPPAFQSQFDLERLGRLPVLHGGRIKPLDTVARTTLLSFRGKQSLRTDTGRLDALPWLMQVLADPASADRLKSFVIHDPDVLGLFGLQTREKYFSFEELTPNLDQIRQQAENASKAQAPARTRFQRAIIHLRERIVSYQMLRVSIQDPDSASFPAEIATYAERIKTAADLLRSHQEPGPAQREQLRAVAESLSPIQLMAEAGYFRCLPPLPGDPDDAWRNVGEGLLLGLSGTAVHPVAANFARLAETFRKGDPAAFARELDAIEGNVRARQPDAAASAGREFVFNHVEPFTRGMTLYVLAFLLACVAWLRWPETLGRASYAVLAVAFLVHTGGLFARIVLQGRPPVTNLYSSAVFVGWAAVLLAIVIEAFFRRGFGVVVGAATGFATLIVAHHLAVSGDTMEMMRAVLDSNFWLGTHVVTITIGYSSTFLAGFLAHVYILRGVFSRSLSRDAAAALVQMVYGVVCFSLFFSFIGTVLGGIWADQSWGRFWGWDPKENGALLIVLWNAIILHARGGRLVGDRGLMVMAVCGNVITALSWFGVNMLGIGLHSYGFTDAAAFWLIAFSLSQWAVMVAGTLPRQYWKSGAVLETPARQGETETATG